MFKCQKNRFWLERPINLFCDMSIIPLDNMNISEQMNSITRLIILVFFVLLLVNFKYSLLFFLISLLLIIILYYIQRNQMKHFNTEHYIGSKNFHDLPLPRGIGTSLTETPSSKRWCNDSVNLENSNGFNPSYFSANQKLAGKPNPKTLVQPVITPPISDLTYWRNNNMITHSAINAETEIDVSQSGYMVDKPCSENYVKNSVIEKYTEPHYIENTKQPVIENYTEPHYIENTQQIQPDIDVRPNEPGWVNTSCGYNPEQLETTGLPTNLASGNCSQDPVFKEYNENLFTDIIQPGAYTTSQIIEPINSNIGISFQQQFPPLTSQVDPISGDILYTQHDPRIMKQEEDILVKQTEATESNIYDPRFSGYGTSYRSYTDDLTGQTRFFYDDVNAIRMPNYIVRSKIDNETYADKYGPIPKNNEFGNPLTEDIRKLANDSWLNNSIDFRTDLQERLMRKNNANAWQRRKAPISTMGQINGCK